MERNIEEKNIEKKDYVCFRCGGNASEKEMRKNNCLCNMCFDNGWRIETKTLKHYRIK